MATKEKPTHRLTELKIVRHYDTAGKVTGHTVHHEMEPIKRNESKSGAFYESYKREAHPFGADAHDSMMDHVEEHLGGE